MLRALASGSLSLTELDGLIGALSYPSLERRLVAMRLAGLVEPVADAAKGIPYAVTGWLRQGVAPLAVAIRWERCYLPDDTEPIKRIDAETGLLLSAPMLRLDPDFSAPVVWPSRFRTAGGTAWAASWSSSGSGRSLLAPPG